MASCYGPNGTVVLSTQNLSTKSASCATCSNCLGLFRYPSSCFQKTQIFIRSGRRLHESRSTCRVRSGEIACWRLECRTSDAIWPSNESLPVCPIAVCGNTVSQQRRDVERAAAPTNYIYIYWIKNVLTVQRSDILIQTVVPGGPPAGSSRYSIFGVVLNKKCTLQDTYFWSSTASQVAFECSRYSFFGGSFRAS
jgi:hypothetical protein